MYRSTTFIFRFIFPFLGPVVKCWNIFNTSLHWAAEKETKRTKSNKNVKVTSIPHRGNQYIWYCVCSLNEILELILMLLREQKVFNKNETALNSTNYSSDEEKRLNTCHWFHFISFNFILFPVDKLWKYGRKLALLKWRGRCRNNPNFDGLITSTL